ncbi:hypothetical protein F2Q68_00045172 [Brassica cretica]|uniref:Uncharacterized protein n=1 Tax=Brassica cretica TaxID=69181 RepID=A0A8S9LM88_BRACR|nr:hypothetical protein F2Q68_00045172 [Brassica cretica]
MAPFFTNSRALHIDTRPNHIQPSISKIRPNILEMRVINQLVVPARVHPISPSPKAFLILDELSLSSIRSQLTSRTATARVPDQTRSIPARASALVHSSSFQLEFQLVPVCVPSSSRFSWWSGSTIFKT